MNNFPKWWDTTITVYNKFQDPQTDIIKWYRTVVDNCFWKYSDNKVVINNTILDSNKIVCRIPKDDRYLPRYEWENKPNDTMKDYFTLGVGDIVVKGLIEEDIDEYVSGKHSTDLINKFKKLQGCMIIEAMSDNSGTMRNNKHYYISGI